MCDALTENQFLMYLLTEWEGRMEKYLARGHGVRTERSKVRAPRPRAKHFPVRPDLNQVNKHFIIWALYTIHEDSEYDVWTTFTQKIYLIC